jgi:hypothetical protein
MNCKNIFLQSVSSVVWKDKLFLMFIQTFSLYFSSLFNFKHYSLELINTEGKFVTDYSDG